MKGKQQVRTTRPITLLAWALAISVGAQPTETGKTALPTPPPGYHWRPLQELSDEFNETQLDRDKWLPYHPYYKGRPPSRYVPQNVSIGGGNLQLRSSTNAITVPKAGDPTRDSWITAACVTSKDSIAHYGYYEARIKASHLPMTSSFWFQGKYSEIDVEEDIGAPIKDAGASRFMLMHTHYFPRGWASDQDTHTTWKMPYPAADDYHVYGLWWKDKDTVAFYHDGIPVGEMHPRGEFLEGMYMFFDTEVADPGDTPPISSLRDNKVNTMLVDWVRSWVMAPN